MGNSASRTAVLVTIATLGTAVSACGPRPNAVRYEYIHLCAPRTATGRTLLPRARRIVVGRLRAFPKFAPRVGRGHGSCLSARLAGATTSQLRRASQILAEPGAVIWAAMARQPLRLLYDGQRVRYAGSMSGRSNRKLPAVRPLFSSAGIISSSAVMMPGQAIGITLRMAASRIWGRWTAANIGHYSPIIVDRTVVADAQVESAITSGRIIIAQPGGSPRFSLRAVLAYLRFGPLPFRWASVTVE